MFVLVGVMVLKVKHVAKGIKARWRVRVININQDLKVDRCL